MRTKDYYYDRVNRVLDHIGEHLDGDLSLGRLSKVGCFSPFHFHRIFQGITGETLHDHVRRIVTPSANCRYDLGVAFPRQAMADDLLGSIVRTRGGSTQAVPLPGSPGCSAKGFSIRYFDIDNVAAIHCGRDLDLVACA